MNKKNWVLTDLENQTWINEINLDNKDLGFPEFPGLSIHKKVLHGGLSDGVDIIEIKNGALSLIVIPSRGMNIWRGDYMGDFLGWKSPSKGPVHPKFVNLSERGGLGWLSGFDELVTRCGLESNGAPCIDVLPNNMGVPTKTELNLHGRIANIPASYVEVQITQGDPPEIRILGTVEESTLFCPQFKLLTTISTHPGSNSFKISDKVINTKGTETEMQLLYHCNLGRPFLEKDSHLSIPALERAPRDPNAAKDMDSWAKYNEPTPGYVEQCYWHVPCADRDGNTLALLKNRAGDKGVAVRFNTKQLPCFTQWKNTGAESDGYVTGLEPGTNYPNPRSFERTYGRTIKLAPGKSYNVELTIEVCNNTKEIKALEKEIAQKQGDSTATIYWKPQEKFSCM